MCSNGGLVKRLASSFLGASSLSVWNMDVVGFPTFSSSFLGNLSWLGVNVTDSISEGYQVLLWLSRRFV